MVCNDCGCKFGCVAASIVSGIVIAIITAILGFLSLITVTPVFLWVTLGIAVVLLALAFLRYSGDGISACSGGGSLTMLVISLIATALGSVILLGSSFGSLGLIGSGILGLTVGFLFAALVSLGCIIIEGANCGEEF